MTTALVIGASGLVGTYLATALKSKGYELITTHCSSPVGHSRQLDIHHEVEIFQLVQSSNPNVIFLPAALTNVDYCESHPHEAYQINVLGTRNVVKAAMQYSAKLVFFSSDYVFDGQNGPYTEEDQPHPICEYGNQKLIAEHLIATALSDYLIIRTTVVYGWEHQGKNFATRLIKALKSREEVRVPTDQVGTPTFANYLAGTTVDLAETGAQGIYNIAGRELMSRYEFACSIAKVFGLDAKFIHPVVTNELRQSAPRPLNAGISINKVLAVLNTPPRSTIEYLESMAEEQKAGSLQISKQTSKT